MIIREYVTLNLRLDHEANRVLDVVKAVYGLRNKSEAANKLIHENAASILEPFLRQEFIDEVISETKEWEEKHCFKRRMNLKELEAL